MHMGARCPQNLQQPNSIRSPAGAGHGENDVWGV